VLKGRIALNVTLWLAFLNGQIFKNLDPRHFLSPPVISGLQKSDQYFGYGTVAGTLSSLVLCDASLNLTSLYNYFGCCAFKRCM